MTNEEAIKKLKVVQAEFNGNWIDYGGINQAFEKAYQALQKVDIPEQITIKFDYDTEEDRQKLLSLLANANDDKYLEERDADAYETGYLQGHVDGYSKAEKEYAKSPCKLSEKLKERISESVCKYCQMNKHCELCEISRVFSIIALTDKEMKEGAE